MSNPKLLLLDEPSAGLAPVVMQAIFEVVRKMSAEGYTVLIVEQNIRQVLRIAQRVAAYTAILAKGLAQLGYSDTHHGEQGVFDTVCLHTTQAKVDAIAARAVAHGANLRKAAVALHRRGFQMALKGGGLVVRTSPAPGDSLTAGGTVTVWAQ